jgi:hypothetical protein
MAMSGVIERVEIGSVVRAVYSLLRNRRTRDRWRKDSGGFGAGTLRILLACGPATFTPISFCIPHVRHKV